MRHPIVSGKARPLAQRVALFSLLLAACQASSSKKVEEDASSPPDSEPDATSTSMSDSRLDLPLNATLDSASERPLVACGSSPATGDRCNSLPTGMVCRQDSSCWGGCSVECSCVAGIWTCEGPVCRDYFGDQPAGACGTTPLCQVACGYSAAKDDGGTEGSVDTSSDGSGDAVNLVRIRDSDVQFGTLHCTSGIWRATGAPDQLYVGFDFEDSAPGADDHFRVPVA